MSWQQNTFNINNLKKKDMDTQFEALSGMLSYKRNVRKNDEVLQSTSQGTIR